MMSASTMMGTISMEIKSRIIDGEEQVSVQIRRRRNQRSMRLRSSSSFISFPYYASINITTRSFLSLLFLMLLTTPSFIVVVTGQKRDERQKRNSVRAIQNEYTPTGTSGTPHNVETSSNKIRGSLNEYDGEISGMGFLVEYETDFYARDHDSRYYFRGNIYEKNEPRDRDYDPEKETKELNSVEAIPHSSTSVETTTSQSNSMSSSLHPSISPPVIIPPTSATTLTKRRKNMKATKKGKHTKASRMLYNNKN